MLNISTEEEFKKMIERSLGFKIEFEQRAIVKGYSDVGDFMVGDNFWILVTNIVVTQN